MPAPGDSAVLPHKWGVAKWGPTLPWGTHRLSIPGCGRAKPLAQGGEREDPAAGGPQDHRLVNLSSPRPHQYRLLGTPVPRGSEGSVDGAGEPIPNC